MEATPSIFARLWLALWLPWKLLLDAVAAGRVLRALSGEQAQLPATKAPAATSAPEPKPAPAAAKPPPAAPSSAPALHLLAILQREGRLVDFLQEELGGLPDDQVGAGARVVHEGCRRALAQYLKLVPVRSEEEGATITLPAGFDAGLVRLTGNVVGSAPFTGKLSHRGWRASEVNLPAPPSGQDATVVMPAEVELP